MADLLQDGVAWLLGKLQAYASQTGTYSRGARTISGLKVTLGRKILKVNDGAGNTRIEVTDADILVGASLLVFEGEQVPSLPECGDRFEETLEGNAIVYEILPYGDEPVYRFSDPWQKMIRIHMKTISTTPTA